MSGGGIVMSAFHPFVRSIHPPERPFYKKLYCLPIVYTKSICYIYSVYTLREFRAKTKEAFDKARDGSVEIRRGKEVYILMYSSLEGEYPNRPEDKEITMDPITKQIAETRSDWKSCKHGADPKFCRYAKNGKPCK